MYIKELILNSLFNKKNLRGAGEAGGPPPVPRL